MPAFDDIRFPTAISLGASGGPERPTDVVTLASGGEQRNARWAHSRRRYDAGFGIASIGDARFVARPGRRRADQGTASTWIAPASH